MIFRVDKERLLSEIRNNVDNSIYNHLCQLTSGCEVTMYTLRDTIKNAVVEGIEEGFRTMLDNRYTDEDFEKDVGLS